MEFAELQISLRKFSEKHDLIDQALARCRTFIINHAEEYPEEGYPLEEVELRMSKQEFVCTHSFFPTPYLKTQIDLYRLSDVAASGDDCERFGYYILETNEEGDSRDDWLVYETA
jgi:hypothetical protein